MKWFQHESDAVKDEKIQELMDFEGITGYGIYFILCEFCAEKIDEKLSPSINVSWPYVERLCHSKRSTVRRVTRRCATLALLTDNSTDTHLICEIPNLLKRLDNWSRRSVVATEQLPIQREYNNNKKTTTTEKELNGSFTNDQITDLKREISKIYGWSVMSEAVTKKSDEILLMVRGKKGLKNPMGYAMRIAQNKGKKV